MALLKTMGSCLLLLCLSLLANAQSPEISVETKDLQSLTAQQMTQSTAVANSQDLNNQVQVWQIGESNQMTIQQNGVGNASVAIQRGSDNQYELTVSGNNNSTYLLQEGDDNQVRSNAVRGNDLDQQISQQGNGHELDLQNYTQTVRGLKVHQQGEVGMKVTIYQY